MMRYLYICYLKNTIKILSNKLKSQGFIPGKWIKHLKHCLSSKIKSSIQVKLTNGKYDYLSVEELKKAAVTHGPLTIPPSTL